MRKPLNGSIRRVLQHPLAEKEQPPRGGPPTMSEATIMTFASEDLFRGISMTSLAELESWLRQEPDQVRARLIDAMIGCRRAMRR